MYLQADFLDAHERHRRDAEFLNQAHRWANADHLYGIAAECGLKHLMRVFGMEVDSLGRPKGKDKVHDVWERFESYRSGHPQGTRYALPTENPFHDWDVSDSYAHQSNFNQARAQSRQAGVQIVCELIKKARMEGLI